MDVPVESPLTSPGAFLDQPGRIAGRPIEEWNAAYAKVESYVNALRIRNKVLLNRVVIHVLQRTMQRAEQEPDRNITELAAETMDQMITEWFGRILQEPPTGADHMLSTRGRLALLLAEMPDKWQDQFLHPGPWPPEFVTAMRDAYLRAGPDFQLAKMTPRPLDLGPVTTLTRLPLHFQRWLLIWFIGALLLIAFFVITHQFGPPPE